MAAFAAALACAESEQSGGTNATAGSGNSAGAAQAGSSGSHAGGGGGAGAGGFAAGSGSGGAAVDGCAQSGVPVGGAHGYFESLNARPDCAAAYSLRDNAQIEQYRTSKNEPASVFYLHPDDPDPRGQDAAKIVIPDGKNSLPTQLHLPIPTHTGESLLVTWDAWWGSEFAFEQTGIGSYKAFNLCSPGNGIWTEVRARFSLAQSAPEHVAMTDVRQYALPALIDAGSNATTYPTVNGKNYGGNALGPMVADFGVAPERWTRYWAFFDPEPSGEWYLFSLWVADEERDPVRLHEALKLKPRAGNPPEPSMKGAWDILRLEYNTSTSEKIDGRGPLVAYARNVVMLKGPGLSDVESLLKRPE